MPKEAETKYFENMTEELREYLITKPFSDSQRGAYLIDMGQILSLIRQPPGRLLDIGCGSGWTSAMFASSGYNVLGIDIAFGAIELAHKTFRMEGLQFAVMDFEFLPFNTEFEVVVIYDCLHHSENERVVLEGVFRALKPEGEVIVVEPGRGHHQSEDSKRAMAVHGVIEKDMPPSMVVPLLREIGFAEIRVFPRARYQAYERNPQGRASEMFVSLFGKPFASFLKNMKYSLAPNMSGVVLARKRP